MRNLTIDEQAAVAGGSGINIGHIGSGNSAGNGNSVDAGGNSFSADGNASGNTATTDVSNATNTHTETATDVQSSVHHLIGSIL